MKEFLAGTGLNFIQCYKVLKDEHNTVANVNMTLPPETAELLALHFGIELTVVPAQTAMDELQEEFASRPRNQLESRPPVVTVLGHVDHGKTSLLDAVRRTRVAAAEDGGITQHIGAYHIQTAHGPVTFLDTPGHEAFTAMRARGAQLTDVVVLVVAADDGIMPQTVEAISHAKAANVPIVVALNKIDLGDQNKLKIFGQLSGHGLTPSGDWGGEVDVIPTSAVSGVGIQELVEHLADLSSLLDLKADPTLPARGTVIESETKPGAGPVVRLLVQEGTLRTGDFVVCGPAYGKVRALLDDRNQRIAEARPSIPVEVWGLDDVPTAGDKLYVLDNLKRAAEIAAQVKQTRIESARVQTRRMRTLEEMLKRRGADEVPDLNVVIKADVDGSVSAIKHTLDDIPSDEVRLTIRHAGVGPITDSDILLATACDGLVLAFRVDIPAGVRRLAEQNGVDVRSYRVIYDVCDDIKKALEGLLEPEEHIESRGVAEVRQIFRLGKKLGIIAGSYVVDGTIDRSHFANVVRDGTMVRERCKFNSLRRFKDDVREVRAGLECGIRLEGFDDVHVGDKIQTFEVVKTARTLQLTRS
jgi:translation initiation factor IF-2